MTHVFEQRITICQPKSVQWHLSWSISKSLSSDLARKLARLAPAKPAPEAAGTLPAGERRRRGRHTHLDLARNHEVVDVEEGLLDALSDRHQPVVPENEDLRGKQGRKPRQWRSSGTPSQSPAPLHH